MNFGVRCCANCLGFSDAGNHVTDPGRHFPLFRNTLRIVPAGQNGDELSNDCFAFEPGSGVSEGLLQTPLGQRNAWKIGDLAPLKMALMACQPTLE